MIKENIQKLVNDIELLTKESSNESNVKLCVATKYATIEQMKELVAQGVNCFGENKVQDALKKIEALSNFDIDWHFIGHLQTNKVSKIVGRFHCIQSVDSIKVLEKINICSLDKQITQNCLLQINIGNDPNKYGFSIEELKTLENQLFSFSNVEIKGLMMIPPLNLTSDELNQCFAAMKLLYKQLQSKYGKLTVLSMGMSQDYKIAIKNGSNFIRVGRMIFA